MNNYAGRHTIPLIIIGLAEFGDKTQLLILLLSSKTEKHMHLLLGIMLAFLVVDGAAILVGKWITTLLSVALIKMLSGIIFIIVGIIILRDNREEIKGEYYYKNPFYSGFVLIFLSEWGDKTQIVSGLLATKYNGLMVLIGAITSLTLSSVIAIYLGKFISRNIERGIITKIAGILFILIGISFFTTI